jgi:hypothetical protein
MFEPDGEVYRGLDPETVRRIRELFGGRTCCRCGSPAERMAAERFYCAFHFEQKRAPEKCAAQTHRWAAGSDD